MDCIEFPVLAVISLLTLIIIGTNGEEECLKSRVWCYECQSWTDNRCADPFNVSVDQNLLSLCEGCCVKIVFNRDTPYQSIRRTCTSKIQINLFMVDHVCMEESDGHGMLLMPVHNKTYFNCNLFWSGLCPSGHMCFCENDGCNSAKTNHQYFHCILNLLIPIVIICLKHFEWTQL